MIFGVKGRVKHSETGKANPNLEIYKFPEDLDICPVETLKAYLERTKTWRGKEESKIFLSYVKPHAPISQNPLQDGYYQCLRGQELHIKVHGSFLQVNMVFKSKSPGGITKGHSKTKKLEE